MESRSIAGAVSAVTSLGIAFIPNSLTPSAKIAAVVASALGTGFVKIRLDKMNFFAVTGLSGVSNLLVLGCWTFLSSTRLVGSPVVRPLEFIICATLPVVVQFLGQKACQTWGSSEVKRNPERSKVEQKAGSCEYARVSTPSLSSLVEASCSFYYSSVHGKLLSLVDSSVSFFQTALLSVAQLVGHLALALLSLPAVVTQSGRQFLSENLIRSAIDLSASGIGLFGTVCPWLGAWATANELRFLNRFVLKYGLVSKKTLKDYKVDNLVFLVNYRNRAANAFENLAIEEFGGDYPFFKQRAI